MDREIFSFIRSYFKSGPANVDRQNHNIYSNTIAVLYCALFVSDIAVFVLKMDVKLQLTNYCALL